MRRHLILVVRTQNVKTGSVGYSFLVQSALQNFFSVSAIKAVFALSLSPLFYSPSHSICWFVMAVKSYFRQVPQSWAVSTMVSLASGRVAIVASNRQARCYGVNG